ncbi:hypothetical protein DPMN_114943 [Dreissena polymorpha]|uniref:Uncharacterized protein n=1 Tax=Dreissena polymorpha TaxID=45954 RepID=A0A9D4KL24_DREPO|nr:hypothetical protein DPMN_114943 [Dreissena polymorpha]
MNRMVFFANVKLERLKHMLAKKDIVVHSSYNADRHTGELKKNTPGHHVVQYACVTSTKGVVFKMAKRRLNLIRHSGSYTHEALGRPRKELNDQTEQNL